MAIQDELKTPCGAMAADGVARGVLLGLCWGLVFDVAPHTMLVHGDATSPPAKPPTSVKRGPSIPSPAIEASSRRLSSGKFLNLA